MIGLSDKGWLVEMVHASRQQHEHELAEAVQPPVFYEAYFGLGHTVRLIDKPGVFKVSLAGLALGSQLLKMLDDDDLSGRFLDLGTGSGVQALLLRSLGATDIVAVDISGDAVMSAANNEILNFGDHQIQFRVADLFSGLDPHNARFDTIIFNPPGWRTPSPHFLDVLHQMGGHADMDTASMFYGEQTLLRFLHELPDHLHRHGRAIVGINSLIGIQDVLDQYRDSQAGQSPLRFRLMERHTFPLLFYSDSWKKASSALLEEFQRWRESKGAAYTVDSQGQLYWSYELIECRLKR